MYTAKYSPILTLAILSIPLFDMIRLFTVRIIQRKSPFSPDMNHIHHLLLKLGLSHRSVRRIILIANLSIIGIIYPLRSINNNVLLILLLFLITLTMTLPTFIYELIKSENSIATRIWFKSFFVLLSKLFSFKRKEVKNFDIPHPEENYIEKPLRINKVQRNYQPTAPTFIKAYIPEKQANDNLVP
jgi:UDP-N-acetylmuramyl pentapeptide phosphotransferase/UDP-N-acetylglucosamine-1-phosphate transferase